MEQESFNGQENVARRVAEKLAASPFPQRYEAYQASLAVVVPDDPSPEAYQGPETNRPSVG